jgi:hypothetical protein
MHRSRVYNNPMLIKLKHHFGVRVHWSVYHSGISTTARVLANEVWRIGSGVIRARSNSTKHTVSFVSIFSTCLTTFLLKRFSKTSEDQNSAVGFLMRVLGFTAEEDASLGINQCFEKYCMND